MKQRGGTGGGAMFLAWSYANWVDLLVFAFSKGVRYYIFAQYLDAS